MTVPQPLYSIGTWDTDLQAYSPQAGLQKSFNLTAGELRQAIHTLRSMGYSAHRRRAGDGTHYDNDTYVLTERTDGESELEISERWKR